MAANTGSVVPHVVVDSAAFIKRARLETFGNKIYTTPSVLKEIRDPQTRAFVKCLPYPLNVEQPMSDSIKYIKSIAKKIGDLPVLSETDIELLALAYELHRTHIGEPVSKPVVCPGVNKNEQDFPLAFQQPLPNNLSELSKPVRAQKNDEKSESDSTESDSEDDDIPQEEEEKKKENFLPAADDWICEANFAEMALKNFGLGAAYVSDQQAFDEDNKPPAVACLTTDFAMQNVLLHSGLHLLSMNGLKILRLRNHLLWCGSCFRPTKRTDTYFCPSCGHPNLRRIPITLHEDGRLEFHFSSRFKKSLRGLQQPVWHPKGGKYADNPIYCADQRLPDRRPAKPKNANVHPIASNGLLELEDPLSDLMLGADSMAFPLHDVNSRAARMGIRSDHQIAPRSWLKPSGEHGLKPTRGKAHLVKPRTGNKKHKRR